MIKEPEPIESNNFYFAQARNYFGQHAVLEINEEIENQQKKIDDDDIWEYRENIFIQGCAKDNCQTISTLEEAKKLCLEDRDCYGVISSKDSYQLRGGPGLKPSKTENSWIRRTVKCDDLDATGAYLDVALMEERYPVLKQAKTMRDGKCEYSFGLSHLNDLIRFNKNMKPKVILQPDKCSFKSQNKNSIIFGIKTIPSASDFRQAIRETWLSKKIWDWLGFEIKIVFVVGRPGEIDLDEETRTYNDILIVDFDESHYNLPFKDIAFLRFIKNRCSNVDFVFKGDDDIMLILGLFYLSRFSRLNTYKFN